MLPVLVSKFFLSIKGSCTQASAIRQDIFGFFVEIINSIVDRWPWRFFFNILESLFPASQRKPAVRIFANIELSIGRRHL